MKQETHSTTQNKIKTVYLSGPMDFTSGSEATQWRGCIKDILKYLTNDSIHILDPTDPNYESSLYTVESVTPEKYFANSEYFYENNRSYVLQKDLKMVEESDIIIAMVPNYMYTVGSVHEIVHALEKKKTVFLIHPVTEENIKFSNWYIGLIKPNFVFDGLGFHEKQEDKHIQDILNFYHFDEIVPSVQIYRSFLNWLIAHYTEYFI